MTDVSSRQFCLSNKNQVEPFRSGVEMRTRHSRASLTRTKNVIKRIISLSKANSRFKNTPKSTKADAYTFVKEDEDMIPFVGSVSNLVFMSIEENICDIPQFTFIEWWAKMLAAFDRWCKWKADHAACKRLAKKYSFRNCRTAYFTGAEVTDWLMWYFSVHPYITRSSIDHAIKRENIASLLKHLYKQNEFVEVDHKKSPIWTFSYFISKLDGIINDKVGKRDAFIDSKYRVYYRLCSTK